jgi:Helix-turn-helix domain
MADEYLTEKQVEAILGVKVRTLQSWRLSGYGPEFFKFGTKVRYTRELLDKWAAAQRATSTTDYQHRHKIAQQQTIRKRRPRASAQAAPLAR